MIKFAILPGVLMAATVATTQLVQQPAGHAQAGPAAATAPITVTPAPQAATAPVTVVPATATSVGLSPAMQSSVPTGAMTPASVQADIEAAVTAALKAQAVQQQAAAAEQQQTAALQHTDSTSMTTMVISIVGFLTLCVQLGWKAYTDQKAARDLAEKQSGISQALETHQAIVLGRLTDASKAAAIAYTEANNLNQKLHSLGLKVRENSVAMQANTAAVTADTPMVVQLPVVPASTASVAPVTATPEVVASKH